MKIDSFLHEVSKEVLRFSPKDHEDYSIYSGCSGIAFFIAQLTANKDYAKQASFLLKLLLEKSAIVINNQSHPRSGFMNGLAGYGWLMCKLNNLGLLEDIRDSMNQLDSYFENLLTLPNTNNYSLGQGWAGIGMFYLRRNLANDKRAYRIFQSIVTKIQQERKLIEGRKIWEDYLIFEREGVHNVISMGHGTPGIASFLMKVKRTQSDLVEGKRYFKEIIMEYLEMKNRSVNLSLYPLHLNKPQNDSRVSWMEGDFTIALLLTHYYRNWKEDWIHKELTSIGTFHNENWSRIIDSTPTLNRKVPDVSLTSGSCGLWQINKFIYDQTGIMPYRELGNRWMNFTLQHQVKSKDNSAGYYNVKFSKEDDKIIELNDNGLMNGISGVGLCLLVESVGLNLCEDLLIL